MSAGTPLLDAVAPLVRAGVAVHRLRPRSKAPVENRWSDAPVATLDSLRATYAPGCNVGVRPGETSRVGDLYLHLIDLDIRIADQAPDAWAALRQRLPMVDTLPFVISGSGGESRHFYFVTDKPFRSRLLATSEGKHRRDKIDPETGEIKQGWSYDWEIELFGTGKQAVLRPAFTPKPAKPYVWGREIDFSLLDLGLGPIVSAAQIEALGVVEAQTYEYESRAPLEFKPGRLEADLDLVPVSELHYDDWIRLGQALHHQFGGSKEGFDLWLKHTQRSTKFTGEAQIREMRRVKWPSFGRYRGKPVTMGTVRIWAQAAHHARLEEMFDEEGGDGFDEPRATEKPAPAAAVGGTLEDDLLGDGTPALVASKDEPVAWRSKLDLTEEGGIRPTLHNVTLLVRHDPRTAGVAKLNQFTAEVVQLGKPGVMPGKTPKGIKQLKGAIWRIEDPVNGDLWTDEKDNGIRDMFEAPIRQGGYGLKLTDRDLEAAIDLVARDEPFHPVRDYLSGLSWDGRARMETLFIRFLGAPDTPYTRAISRLMLLGAVTRVFEPGHKFDYVVILEGLQGKGKSTFIAILARHWFAELQGDFSDRKRMVEKMQGSWILEIPELSGFGKAEVQEIKAFVSAQSDKDRLAYARRAAKFPRQCVFLGSTNEREYLRDNTGGRRFWPVECHVDQIDTIALEAEIDQVWAEALAAYRAMRAAQPKGTLPLYLSSDDARMAAERQQESRRVETPEDAMAGVIGAWLDLPLTDESGFDEDGVEATPVYRNETCLIEIWVDCLKRDRSQYDHRASLVVRRALQLVPGWSPRDKAEITARYGRQRVFWRDGTIGRPSPATQPASDIDDLL